MPSSSFSGLPAAVRTLRVQWGANDPDRFDNLAAAYQAAQPGDWIVVNDSPTRYPALTCDRTIGGVTADKPVVIRPRTRLGAKLEKVTVEDGAEHLYFYGFRWAA